MSTLQLRLMGEFRATLGGKRLENFPTDKVRALLAYLAIEANRAHGRTHLATLLWGEWDETAARANLRKSLFRLRQTLGGTAAELLTISRASVEFHAGSAQIDVQKFLTLAQGDDLSSLEEAAELYYGTFLAGLTVVDARSFEEWLTVQREHLHQQALNLFDKLAELYLAREDYPAAQATALKQLALEPWHEAAHRQLMRAYAAAGQRTQALAQYEQCKAILEEELGVAPAAETEQLAASIGGEAKPAAKLHGFPTLHTPFIGRQTDIERLILRLHDPKTRLVTIAGTGGIGKTRLATEATLRAVNQSIAANAYFIPLRAVTTQSGMWQMIGEKLSVQPGSNGLTPGEIISFIQQKVGLLLLDNYEQLLPSTEVIEQILTAAENTQIIVTSRIPLNIRAEWRLPLDGLPTPDESVTDINSYESVQLLVSTGEQVQPEFAIHESNKVDIVRICRALAGMPLALEMAGSWLALFTPEMLADQIERNIDFLVDTRKDIPSRHRSLRAIFEHSLAQLAGDERQLLGQLACFQDSFTLPAALTVTSAWLVAFNTFIEHALLQRRTDDRYSLHPVLRAFIHEDIPHPDKVLARHAHYYLSEVASLEAVPVAQTVAAIGADIANIYGGWDWALTQGEHSLVAGALPGLAAYYDFRGAYEEGRLRFGIAADNIPASPLRNRLRLAEASYRRRLGDLAGATRIIKIVLGSEFNETRLPALIAQAKINEQQGDYEAATELLNKALPLAQPISREAAQIWAIFGSVYSYWGTMAQRVEAHEKLLAVSLARNDEMEAAGAHALLANIYQYDGKYSQAITHCLEALAIARRLNHQEAIARYNQRLGVIYWRSGDIETAQQYYEQSLTVALEMNHKQGITINYGSLGVLANQRREFEKALYYYGKALHLAEEIGDRSTQAVYTGNMGNVYRNMEQYDEAIACYEMAIRYDEESGALGGVGRHLGNIGDTYKRQERYEEAIAFYEKAIPLLRAHDAQYYLCWVLIFYADSLHFLGRDEEAAVLNAEGCELARLVARADYVQHSAALAARLKAKKEATSADKSE